MKAKLLSHELILGGITNERFSFLFSPMNVDQNTMIVYTHHAGNTVGIP